MSKKAIVDFTYKDNTYEVECPLNYQEMINEIVSDIKHNNYEDINEANSKIDYAKLRYYKTENDKKEEQGEQYLLLYQILILLLIFDMLIRFDSIINAYVGAFISVLAFIIKFPVNLSHDSKVPNILVTKAGITGAVVK